jgi:hypothetical protein
MLAAASRRQKAKALTAPAPTTDDELGDVQRPRVQSVTVTEPVTSNVVNVGNNRMVDDPAALKQADEFLHYFNEIVATSKRTENVVRGFANTQDMSVRENSDVRELLETFKRFEELQEKIKKDGITNKERLEFLTAYENITEMVDQFKTGRLSSTESAAGDLTKILSRYEDGRLSDKKNFENTLERIENRFRLDGTTMVKGVRKAVGKDSALVGDTIQLGLTALAGPIGALYGIARESFNLDEKVGNVADKTLERLGGLLKRNDSQVKNTGKQLDLDKALLAEQRDVKKSGPKRLADMLGGKLGKVLDAPRRGLESLVGLFRRERSFIFG